MSAQSKVGTPDGYSYRIVKRRYRAYQAKVVRSPSIGDPHSDQIASVNSWHAVLNMLDWRLKRGG